MAKVVYEPVRCRCESCETSVDFEVSDYQVTELGHNPEGFRCPVCRQFIRYPFDALPKSWQLKINDDLEIW